MIKRVVLYSLALLLGVLLAAPLAAKVTVEFVEPDRYADTGDRRFDQDRNLERLESFLLESAKECLDADESLTIRVLDVDLAGRGEWWHDPSGLRVMRDIDWPRMKLDYVHLDAGGEVIAEEREWISDKTYLRRSTRRPTERRPLRHEQVMIEEWVQSRFCADRD